MQRYDSYKDSGIQWLGEIPNHWKLRKMKYTFSERSQKGFPNEPLLAATQNHGVIKKSDYENRTVEAIKNLDTLKLVEEGDFVISLRSFQGGIEYSYCRGIISPAYTVLKAHHLTESYFKHLAKSPIFIDLLKSTVTGIREGQNIDYNKLRVEFLPIPPIEEQQAIASYLDTATAKIDEAIAQQQKMIDLLNERKQIIINNAVTKGLNPNAKMKPSGIDWIGNIPDGWSICKVKNKCSIDSGSSFSKEELTDDGKYEVYGGGSMIGHCSKFNCNEQNIIVGRVGSCGKVNFPRTKFWATDNALVLTAHNISLSFFYYCLIAANLSDLNESNAQPLITATKVKNVFIPLPTEIEQVDIADAIEREIQKIELLIISAESQIGLLRERKQIIINDVVTGKVKVV